MSTTAVELSNPLSTAKQAKEMVALAEAEMASEALRQKEKADAEKKALIDKLSKPSGISEQEALNGVFRFPNALCTDNGRDKRDLTIIANDTATPDKGIGKLVTARTINLAEISSRCPLWVISGHFAVQSRCPLYPRKRTFAGGSSMSALCQ